MCSTWALDDVRVNDPLGGQQVVQDLLLTEDRRNLKAAEVLRQQSRHLAGISIVL